MHGQTYSVVHSLDAYTRRYHRYVKNFLFCDVPGPVDVKVRMKSSA